MVKHHTDSEKKPAPAMHILYLFWMQNTVTETSFIRPVYILVLKRLILSLSYLPYHAHFVLILDAKHCY